VCSTAEFDLDCEIHRDNARARISRRHADDLVIGDQTPVSGRCKPGRLGESENDDGRN
jgi:hypothetical protein